MDQQVLDLPLLSVTISKSYINTIYVGRLSSPPLAFISTIIPCTLTQITEIAVGELDVV